MLLNGIDQPGRGAALGLRGAGRRSARRPADREPAAARSPSCPAARCADGVALRARPCSLRRRRHGAAPGVAAGAGRRGCWCAASPPAPRRRRHACRRSRVLKPLHGDEPLLERRSASFCAQDYPAFQIVFGVQDPADPALAVVAAAARALPRTSTSTWWSTAPRTARNRKVAQPDQHAARRPARRAGDRRQRHACRAATICAAGRARWQQPGVGLVTTLYTGLPAHADACRRGSAPRSINHDFLPGALLARALGRQDCLGATMALRRATLERIGGLRALADHLADDAVLGSWCAAQGLAVGAGRHRARRPRCRRPHLPALFAHELRWARTIRALAPAGVRAVGRAVSAVLGRARAAAGGRRGLGVGAVRAVPGCPRRAAARAASTAPSGIAVAAPDLAAAAARPVVGDGACSPSYRGRPGGVARPGACASRRPTPASSGSREG